MLQRPFHLLDGVLLAPKRVPPIVLAVLAQLLALGLCSLLAWQAEAWGWPLSLGTALLLQSLCAVALSYVLRMPVWWLLMQALFVPAVVFSQSLHFAPAWYLAGFIALVLVYWSTFTTQVPLYLSRRQVWRQVGAQLPERAGLRCIDLGSGLGGWVNYLARLRRDSHFKGIEAAPLPCLVGKLRSLFQSNAAIAWGDFWRHDLSAYDVVFAYLSPVPMPDLWEKARREMRPGSLFISYRFAVPGVVPSAVIELHDLGRTQLYLWRL
jgi:hypothetical protein